MVCPSMTKMEKTAILLDSDEDRNRMAIYNKQEKEAVKLDSRGGGNRVEVLNKQGENGSEIKHQ